MSYNRNRETQRRLKKIADGEGSRYCVGVYFDKEQNRYKRYYLGNKEWKRHCHARMRNYYRCLSVDDYLSDEYDIYNGATYNKYTEYWWNIT